MGNYDALRIEVTNIIGMPFGNMEASEKSLDKKYKNKIEGEEGEHSVATWYDKKNKPVASATDGCYIADLLTNREYFVDSDIHGASVYDFTSIRLHGGADLNSGAKEITIFDNVKDKKNRGKVDLDDYIEGSTEDGRIIKITLREFLNGKDPSI